jgi:hypothetical protein
VTRSPLLVGTDERMAGLLERLPNSPRLPLGDKRRHTARQLASKTDAVLPIPVRRAISVRWKPLVSSLITSAALARAVGFLQ